MPLFIRGIPGKSGQKSTFTQEAIGYNTLSKTPAWIAEWLGIENTEKYALTSFKRLVTVKRIEGHDQQVVNDNEQGRN